MSDRAISVKPLVASVTGFLTALAGDFSVDTFSKLCTSAAALTAVAYSLWKWRREAVKFAREEAARAAASGGKGGES